MLLLSFFAGTAMAQNLSITTTTGVNGFCPGSSGVGLIASDTTLTSYLWLNGTDTLPSTTYSAFAAKAGVYSLVSGRDSVTINIVAFNNPTAPVINPAGPISACTGDNIILTSDIPNGNIWSTGDSLQDLQVTADGSYTVTYTDINGCSATSLPTNVTFYAIPTAPVITALGSTVFCTGDSVLLSSNVLTNITWSDNTTDTITYAKNSDAYYVTYTDSNGCKANSNVINVTSNALPTFSILGNKTICTGDTTAFYPSIAGTNFSWSTGETTDTILVTNAGNYSLTLTDNNGCINTFNDQLNLDTALVLLTSALGNTTFCDGGSVDLTGNYSGILWSDSSTNDVLTAATAGVYTYSKTNTCGTFYSNNVTVTTIALPAAPIVVAQGATQFCQGNSVDIEVRPSDFIAWNTGDSTGIISANASGSYYAYYTDTATGCISKSNEETVTVWALPSTTITSAKTQLCSNDSITLSVNPSALWSTGDTTSSITVSTAGAYGVIITDGNGCVDSSKITITNYVPSPVIIGANGTTTFCQGNTIQLISQTTGVTWNTGLASDTLVADTSGNYYAVYQGLCGAELSNNIVVTVNPVPATPLVINSGSLTFCEGDTVLLTSNVVGVWNTGDSTLTLPVSISGGYFITVTDSNGCSSSSNPLVAKVNYRPLPAIITPSGNTTFCAGDSVQLISNLVGNWSTGNVDTIITVRNSGQFNITVTDPGTGCSATSTNVVVTVNPIPAKPVITANRDTVYSSALTGNQWFNVTSGAISGASNTSLVVPATGRYFVVTTQNGCASPSSDTLFVIKLATGTNTSDSWSVYPNPTNGKVFVSRANNGMKSTITILDQSGRMIRNEFLGTTQNIQEFDLSGMPTGMYFVRISNQVETKVLKIIVQ